MVRAGLLRCLSFAFIAVSAGARSPANAGDLAFPAACTPGVDCFVQMLADIDPGPGAVDPFCGSATRDGYPGADIRLPSMADMHHGVDVFAIAAGTVIEARDGIADRLVRTKEEAQAIAGRECGNGLAIDHGNGMISHYCHLRRDSLAVGIGDIVERGRKIGRIGASGLASYPGLHLAVLRDGQVIDPFSGRSEGEGCIRRQEDFRPLFAGKTIRRAGFGETAMLAAGLTGGTVDPERIAVTGPPPEIGPGDNSLVAWSWLINLRPDDRVRLTLYGPAGGVVAAQTSMARPSPGVEMTVFAGRSGRPVPGRYRIVVELLRDGKAIPAGEKSVHVAG